MTECRICGETSEHDCPCEYEWKSLGVLYGISMGKGWVRISTDPTCLHHGTS